VNLKSTVSLVVLATAAAFATTPVLAQQAKTAPYKAPRLSFGAPDLQGVWSNVTMTPLQRAATYGERKTLTPEEVRQMEGRAVDNVEYENKPTDPTIGAEDHTRKNCSGPGGRDCGYNAGWKDSTTQVMRVGGEPRTSFIVSPANGRIPPRIARTGAATGAQRAIDAREQAELAGEGGGAGRAGQNDNPEGRSLGERCIASFSGSAGPMLPNGYYNNNMRLVQSKDAVAIETEMVHDVRVIRIGGTHRTDGLRPYFGDAIGRWEGDTLVVETKNYHPATTFQGSGMNLELTERFTRVGPDRLLYQFTVKDPTVWATPWTGEYEFQTTAGGMYEYACHEGNYGLVGILEGARAEEQEAARRASTGGRAGGTQ